MTEELNEQNTTRKSINYMRKAWKISQSKMAAGIMSPAAYSKYERGVNDISAGNYIKLFNSLSLQQPEYQFKDYERLILREKNKRKFSQYYYRSLSYLEDEISQAQSRHDKKRLDELVPAVEKENHLALTLYLKAAYAWLAHSNKNITDEDRKQARKLIFSDEINSLSIHFLSQYMIFFDFDDIYPWIQQAFDEEKKQKNIINDQSMILSIIDLIIKYLNYCYICGKTDEEYTENVFRIIFGPIFQNVNAIVCRTVGQYYQALFAGDQETCDDIVEILDYAGYRWLIEDTLEK